MYFCISVLHCNRRGKKRKMRDIESLRGVTRSKHSWDFVCLCVWSCLYVYGRVYMFMFVFVCVWPCVYVYGRVRMCMPCVYVYGRVRMCMAVCICVCRGV